MPDVIETTARVAEPADGGFDEAPQPAPADAPEPAANLPAVPEPEPDLPAIPGQNELTTLAQLAATFAGSKLVPSSLQQRPADVLLVLMTARDLGLGITTAFRELHPIDGRVTASPKLKLATVRARGLGRVWKDPASGRGWAKWYATRADAPDIVESSEFGPADAKDAGLVGANCDPIAGTHGQGNTTKGGWLRCGCKKNWATYPARMPSHRALGYLMDDVFGEVGTGLYSADELGAVTDEDGHVVIDVSEVQPLDGMVTPEQQRAADRQAEAEAPADPAELWHLQARLFGLPREQIEAWRQQKYQQERLQGVPTYQLPAGALRLAKSLVTGLESAAKKADPDYDPEQAAEGAKLRAYIGIAHAVTWWHGQPNGGPDPAPEPAPQDAPDASAGPAPQPEPDNAAQEHTGGNAGTVAPTVADASEAMEHCTETVRTMSLAAVRQDLRDYGLPVTGGATTLRARLAARMANDWINDHQVDPTKEQAPDA